LNTVRYNKTDTVLLFALEGFANAWAYLQVHKSAIPDSLD